MTLDFIETPLEEGLQNSVVSLFKRSDFKTLKRVIETKGKKLTVTAANKALGSGTFPNYTDSANNELKSAIRYQTALDVLKELEEQNERFTVAK